MPWTPSSNAGAAYRGTRISGASDAAIFAADSTGSEITGNEINDCGNGGILVQRYEQGRDGTIVTSNRISRNQERMQAAPVRTATPSISFARIMSLFPTMSSTAAPLPRSAGNSASNLQITGNNCSASGETARIYFGVRFRRRWSSPTISSMVLQNGISMVKFRQRKSRLGTCSGNLVRNLTTQPRARIPAPSASASVSKPISRLHRQCG